MTIASVLLYDQEEGTTTTSHFTGHQKVMHVVSHEGSGAAPHYTRDREHQEDDGFTCRAEKHEVLETTADLTINKTMGEDKDSIWRGTAPHHQNWQQQVLTITSRTDNGAVYKKNVRASRASLFISCIFINKHYADTLFIRKHQ